MVALAAVAVAPSALAVDLVTGGYAMAPLGAEGARPGSQAPARALFGVEPVAVLDFTPRGATGPAGEVGAASPRLQFELSLAPTPADRLTSLAFGGSGNPGWRGAPEREGGLTIGGALRFDQWAVGGGYERTQLLGGPAELLAASVGYGPLIASVAMGEVERADEPPLDMLMLSTDLLAWSWLAVESDMALGSGGAEDESMAVGRVGFRLNF